MTQSNENRFTKSIKVLTIEDNQVDRMILESMLTESPQSKSEILSSDTLSAGLKILSENKIDVIVLDLNLPDSNGEETLRVISEKHPEIPIVISTGVYEEELGLQALNAGAQDFLVKGKYTAYILNKSLRYAIERKRLDLDLVETYSKLKETQDQLVQAEKMKVIGGLASGIAHEVRNPLATILYGVTYLSENIKVDDENYESVLSNIKDATSRADGIIKDLLDFSGLKKLDMVMENINVLIEKALVLVNHELEKKHIKVERHFDLNIPQIKIDINRIQQVLLNILLNSIYAVENEGNIIISTRSQKLSSNLNEIPVLQRKEFTPESNAIFVTIEDNGCGIEKEHLDSVFDPFFTTRRAKGGIGLGLSVSQNIIESHEGCLSLNNRPEGGVIATMIFKQAKGGSDA